MTDIKSIIPYAPAIELGWRPGHVLDDSPLTIGTWSPRNADHTFQGPITMRRALDLSRNVPAVRMLQEVGVYRAWGYAVRMGLPLTEHDLNLATALGGLDAGVSPLDMAVAFGTMANNGVFIEPHSVTRITDMRGNIIWQANPHSERVLSPQTAYLMTDMLQTAVTQGTGGNARIPGFRVAGKTGSVELPAEAPEFQGRRGRHDIWFAGYTTRYAAAVWIGYDHRRDEEGNVIHLSTQAWGGQDTARLFRAVMSAIHEGEDISAGTSFERPEGLVQVTLDTISGLLPSELTPAQFRRTDWVNAANVPTERSDIWVGVRICPESNRRANEFCPDAAVVSRIRRGSAEGLTSSFVAAWLEPTGICDLHTTPPEPDLPARICINPAHGGNYALANIAGLGQTGGCPPEFVVWRYFRPENMPTHFCPIGSHALANNVGGSTLPPLEYY